MSKYSIQFLLTESEKSTTIGVQLSWEAGVPWYHGAQLRALFKPSRTFRQYRTAGFKGALNQAPIRSRGRSFSDRQCIFSSPAKDWRIARLVLLPNKTTDYTIALFFDRSLKNASIIQDPRSKMILALKWHVWIDFGKYWQIYALFSDNESLLSLSI